MSIVRWNPFREMEAMHNEMNRLFSLVGGFNAERINDSQWMLPIDVIETPEALKVKAALPGVAPKDVNIEINDTTLTVTAQRRHEDKGEKGGYHWMEQQYGTFSRSLTLPRYADTQKIEARYNQGVLELTIPRKESAKPRRIALHTDEQDSAPLTATLQSSPNEPQQLQETEAS